MALAGIMMRPSARVSLLNCTAHNPGNPISFFVSSQVEPGWRHYTIPVGEYYTGTRPYLVFANDHDVANRLRKVISGM